MEQIDPKNHDGTSDTTPGGEFDSGGLENWYSRFFY